ncbi:MAG: HAMP domain-containing sensor histidine kinase, partial [Leeuwenhoekiella sp.]
MKKRKLYIVIFCVAVLGLLIVQYQYLKIGLNLAKVQFNTKIALTSDDIKRDLSTKNQLTFLIEKAITRDDYFKLSVDSVKDASSYYLDDFLKERLAANGIETDFSYRLFARDTTDYLKSPNPFKNEDSVISYPIELRGFLSEILDKNLILELQFKDLNSYFLGQLNGLTIPTLLFMITIILIVIWVLKTFYWQRSIIMTTNDFINNLTHELKTPVFAIGLATKILEEDCDEQKKPVISLIRIQVDRLKTHIDSVLELASFESKKRVFELFRVDFYKPLKDLCDEFRALSQIEGIDFSYNLEDGKYIICAEVSHLSNAINNLLDNSKKYAEKPKITLDAFSTKKHLIITIKDNGIGLSKIEKRRIFKKYYRVSNGNLHKVHGHGLGLSYVKEIAKRHHAKINIESKLG